MSIISDSRKKDYKPVIKERRYCVQLSDGNVLEMTGTSRKNVFKQLNRMIEGGDSFIVKSVKEIISAEAVEDLTGYSTKELIINWFNHIAQIADDRKTQTGAVMDPMHALDEIKCLAKNSADYVDRFVSEIFED